MNPTPCALCKFSIEKVIRLFRSVAPKARAFLKTAKVESWAGSASTLSALLISRPFRRGKLRP